MKLRMTVFNNSYLSLLMVLVVACNQKEHLPYYNESDFTPVFLTKHEVSKRITHAIAPFHFIDQHGHSVDETMIRGKIHVANFMFTSCGSICPVMTQHMKLVQDAFSGNPNVVLLSYSVTPWIDNVSTLKKYADANQITSPSWHLLTGKKSEIYTLARKSYFAEEDLGFTRDSTEFLHTEHILLVDQDLHIRGVYNGTLQLEAQQLIEDIKELLRENAG